MGRAIETVADRLNIPEEAREPRGRDVLKIDPTRITGDRKGRVVLVTAMTPTPAGEGKTTTTIGLVDGLNRRGVRAVGALREPSLGPLFGAKGGAVGGGKAQVTPGESINLHFTGDLHAVTSAHNLLSAMVDNHIHFRLQPQIDPAKVSWGRVLDMNDRALRRVEVGFESRKGSVRTDRFDITAASEVMAILCLSTSVEDLRARLDRITVGLGLDGKVITAGDIKAGGGMAAILLEATAPNLVRTLEESPVFVHGGPFANVAQGTSTLIQTRLARRLADVVVTEAGFAFDLGGFKFLDLKGRAGAFRPAAVVLVATVRALRFHGGAADYGVPNLEAVERGLGNIEAHVDSMRRLGLPAPILSINRFPDDSADELAAVKRTADQLGITVVEGEYFAKGGEGALALADAVTSFLAAHPADSPDYSSPYELTDPVEEKIRKAAQVVLGAVDIELSDLARSQLEGLAAVGADQFPICFAKTHLSISDNPELKCRPTPYVLQVSALRPLTGAGFLVVLCGSILTMPGLPKVPSSYNIDVAKGDDGRYVVKGLR